VTDPVLTRYGVFLRLRGAGIKAPVVALAAALAITWPPVHAGPAGQDSAAARVDAKKAFEKGAAALQSGDLNLAEQCFRQVLSVDPQSAAVYANLGVIAMRRKDWDGALKLLKKAERLDAKMTGVRLNIGLVEFRRANYAAAIAPLASVLRDQPDSEQARYLLGLCQVLTERFDEAMATLEPLWPQRSEDVMYLYVLSIAANSAGRCG